MVVVGLTVRKIEFSTVLAELDPAAYSWMLALLGGVLLLGALVFWILKRWQQRTREDTTGPSDQLSQFREMFEEGELSSEEFARIRGKLTGRMIQKLDKAPAPEPPPEPPRTSNPPS